MEIQTNFINYAPTHDEQLLDSYSRTITGVVAHVAESVVHIQVQKPVNERQKQSGRPGQRGGNGQNDKGPQLAPASGSGFIISTDGFIVTNNHVIENAKEIRVALADGRTVNAELKGADPSTDIAVIKVDVSGLKALSFADS